MIFSFIQQHDQEWPVGVMCETLGVSSQGFYAWRRRPTSQQQLRRDALLVEIRDAHAESKLRYGSPRIHAELVKGHNGRRLWTLLKRALPAKAVVFETLKRRKRGIFRLVPNPDGHSTSLAKIVAGKPPNARIWEFSRPTAYRMIKAKMEEAGVTGGMAMPKGLRHGHGVACASRNVPLPTIQRWLGHAYLKTTAIYLDVQGVEERNFAKRVW